MRNKTLALWLGLAAAAITFLGFPGFLGLPGLPGLPGVPGAPARAWAQESAAATPYKSPKREECTAELRKDAEWKAELRQQLTPIIHEEDATLMLRNKQHVVGAYAALWIIMAGFVLFMWMRNAGLSAEIARLEREIRAATRDPGGGDDA